YRYLNDNPYLPFSAVKLYTEWGAEDSSGSTKTPTGRAYIYGLLIDEPFRLRGVDFRAEWADTGVNAQYGPAWYRHGVYTTGYTFEGRVIGHHMGGDSKDLFLRASYNAGYATEVGVEADREWSGVHSAAGVKRDWIAADIHHETSGGLGLSGGAGFERLDGPNETVNNPTVWVRAEWRF
ncbi:MAG: capsule assembly Wzi family protein, partial [Deltaproteobacteria bacterium]|nr:capsule assembly Wzi family protein [Deltaproteobacteria bacterium]